MSELAAALLLLLRKILRNPYVTNWCITIILIYKQETWETSNNMRKMVCGFGKRMAAGVMAALCMSVCTIQIMQAEEPSGYYDEAGNWKENTWFGDSNDIYSEGSDTAAVSEGILTAQESILTAPDISDASAGTYSVGDGWSVDSAASTESETVYKQDAHVGTDGTSTITCRYMDTNYSVLEYEQLRDMLTNNLLYSNVNAQISTSAVYTQTKDYLYIILVDDSAQEYRDIYHYVVGDYRCFCVGVREYRSEAEQASAAGLKTPGETGKTTAEEFTWNTAW